MRFREGGRTVNVHALIAVGVDGDGSREVLGLEIASQTARVSAGMQLVISDAHRGLVDAIGAALPGAGWQRCRTHYLRSLLGKVPKSARPWVASMVRTIFDQPDAASVRARYGRVVEAIEAKFS